MQTIRTTPKQISVFSDLQSLWTSDLLHSPHLRWVLVQLSIVMARELSRLDLE